MFSFDDIEKRDKRREMRFVLSIAQEVETLPAKSKSRVFSLKNAGLMQLLFGLSQSEESRTVYNGEVVSLRRNNPLR